MEVYGDVVRLSEQISNTVKEGSGVVVHAQKCKRLAERCKGVVEAVVDQVEKGELSAADTTATCVTLAAILREAQDLVSLFQLTTKNKGPGKVGFMALERTLSFSMGSTKKKFTAVNIKITELINDLGLKGNKLAGMRRNLTLERMDNLQDHEDMAECVNTYTQHLKSAIEHLTEEKAVVRRSETEGQRVKGWGSVEAHAADALGIAPGGKYEPGGAWPPPPSEAGSEVDLQRQAKLLSTLERGDSGLVGLSDLPGYGESGLGSIAEKAATSGEGVKVGRGKECSDSMASASSPDASNHSSTEVEKVTFRRLLEQPPSVVHALLNKAHLEAVGRVEKVDMWHKSLQMDAPLAPDEEAVEISRRFVDSCMLNYDEPVPDGFYDGGRDAVGKTFQELQLTTRRGPGTREVILVDSTKDSELKDWVAEGRRRTERAGSTLHKIKAISELVTQKMGVPQGQKGGKTDALRCQEEITRLVEKGGSNVVFIGELGFGVGRHRALLFKYLCDRCDVPVRLVRGTLGGQRRAWNVVRYRRLNWVLDLMEAPNRLLREGESLVDGLRRDGQADAAMGGKRIVYGAGLGSIPTPDDMVEMENFLQPASTEQPSGEHMPLSPPGKERTA